LRLASTEPNLFELCRAKQYQRS